MAALPVSREIFGQPVGLYVLFMTETWEKFSYYGMKSLLVIYIVHGLNKSPAEASLIYGYYGGMATFFPLFGGLIADRFLGKRRAVLIGASIMTAGHLMMAFPPLFFAALPVIVIGAGLFSPSLASQIPTVYAEGDPRKNSAYNVYYVGVNLGAFLGPLVCGILGETYGWSYGFSAASLFMALGLAIYGFGGRYLPKQTPVKSQPAAPRQKIVWAKTDLLLLLGAALGVIVFRVAYEQMANTVSLYLSDGVDRHISKTVLFPVATFQSINGACVFLFSPILITLFLRQEKQTGRANLFGRMAQGGLWLALSYAVIALSAAAFPKAPWICLALYFAVATWAELYILPTGISLFGRLAPAGASATFIALWSMAAFFGFQASSLFGTLYMRLGPVVFFSATAGFGLLSAVMFWGLQAKAGGFLERRLNPQLEL